VTHGSLREEFFIPGRKFIPGRNCGGKAVDAKTLNFAYLFTQNHRCTGVPNFGDAKDFCPNLILFFPNNV